MVIQVKEDKLLTFYLADDQVILAKDDIFVQCMLRKLKEAYNEWGGTINIRKTEYMNIGGQRQYLDVENETIRNSKWYKYFGIRISKNECCNDNINSRVSQPYQGI